MGPRARLNFARNFKAPAFHHTHALVLLSDHSLLHGCLCMHSRVCTGVTRWACRRGARSAINSRLVRASMTACDPYAAEGVPSRSSEEKLFRFGILSDVQYAPIDDGKSHGGTPRFYRNSLKVLRCVVLISWFSIYFYTHPHRVFCSELRADTLQCSSAYSTIL